jgi:transcription-repair coupling factor (superfamily II helicase)
VRTVVSRDDPQLLREAVTRELARGGQVFFVYNRVEGLYERADKLQQLMPTRAWPWRTGRWRPRCSRP